MKDIKEMKDMAVTANDFKSKLLKLKKQAAIRKSTNNVSPSTEYLKESNENARLLYKDQINAIKKD